MEAGVSLACERSTSAASVDAGIIPLSGPHSHTFWLCPLLAAGLRHITHAVGFPGGSASKESACNVEELGLIPRLGRSLEENMVTHSSVLAWKIPWTEKSGRLQPTGSQKSQTQLGD